MEETTSPKRRTTRRQAAADTTPKLSEYGHVQPQALEFEEAVLGALMIDSDAIGRLGGMLKPESFYDKRNQLLFEAIQQMDLADRPIDILTVTEYLRTKGNLDEVGGPVYIAQLTSKIVSSVNIEYHANIIAQKKLARDLIKFTSKTQVQAFDETQDVEALMQQAESELFEISRHNMKQDFTQINPVIEQAYKQIQTASKNTSGISGLSTGYHRLDKVLSGWQPTDLIILAARPAMGKTAFALSLIRNMAIDQGIPCGMFSLEMGNVQLVQRLICNVCQIPGDKIRSGQLERYEWGQLDQKIVQLENAPLYVDDTPQLSVFELRSKARRMVREHGVKMIFIDYLQLMTANAGKGSRQEEISTISRALKGLAKELGEDAELYELIGILHDIDFQEINEDMEKHGEVGYEILKAAGIGDEIALPIRRHNHMLFDGEYTDTVEICLQTADSVSGLVIACAYVKGGKITEVTPKTVTKKYKAASFAAGCDRNRIAMSDALLPRERMYEIAIEEITAIKDELGLS